MLGFRATCGHEYQADSNQSVYGLCPSCRADLKLDALAALEGSEKQIAWAADIRESAISGVVKMCATLSSKAGKPFAVPGGVRKVLELMVTETSSKWWIDHRNSPDEAMAARVLGK